MALHFPIRTEAERKFVEDLIVYLDYKIREGERIRNERKDGSFRKTMRYLIHRTALGELRFVCLSTEIHDYISGYL